MFPPLVKERLILTLRKEISVQAIELQAYSSSAGVAVGVAVPPAATPRLAVQSSRIARGDNRRGVAVVWLCAVKELVVLQS